MKCSPCRSLSSDRYIPLRKGQKSSEFLSVHSCHSAQSAYESHLASETKTKILQFTRELDASTVKLNEFIVASAKKKPSQQYPIRKAADQVIDAPGVIDNFYFNPLDWSSKSMLAIALSYELYLQAKDLSVLKLDRWTHSYVTSVKFHPEGYLLLLGDHLGKLQVHDVQRQNLVRTIKAHHNRIGCIESCSNPSVITGSKDQTIRSFDLRLKNAQIYCLESHNAQVCGLSAKDQLLASGGNDNRVFIWDLKMQKKIKKLKHFKSAVKALEWCPWKNYLLAAGGGLKDHRILFWNFQEEQIQSCVDLNSQVTALHWKTDEQKVVTAHRGKQNGYTVIWDHRTRKVTQQLIGHRGRVLGLALNPLNNNDICTLGADETLRLWRLKTIKDKNDEKWD